MKRAWLAAAVVLGFSTAIAQEQDEAPAINVAEMSADALVARLDELLPGIGAAELMDRKAPQQEFSTICLQLGAPGLEEQRFALCTAMCGKLDESTPQPARVWLLRQLERIGGEESVAPLAALLADNDAEIRDAARRALQKNASTQAYRALRASLRPDLRPDRQVALINALAQREEFTADAVRTLTPFLNSTDRSVSLAAIAAIGDAAATPPDALFALVLPADNAPAGDARDPLAGAATDAILRIIDRLIARGDAAALDENVMLEEALGETAPVRVRHALLAQQVAILGADAAHQVFAWINDEQEDLQVRRQAARLLVEYPNVAETGAIGELLAGAAPAAQAILLDVLADRGDATALPVAQRQLASPDEQVRIAALNALGVLGDASTVPLLVSAAAQAQGDEQEAARAAILRIGGSQVDSALQALLTTGNPAERIEAIIALGARDCSAAVPALLEQARGRDAKVQREALKVIAKLGDASLTPELLDLLATFDPDANSSALEDAIVALSNKIEPADQRAAATLDTYDRADRELRPAFIRVLGRLGGPAALERIRAAAGDSDRLLKDAGVRALAEWPDVAVAKDLMDIARQSDNRAHRVLALQGYIRLAGSDAAGDAAERLAKFRAAFNLAERIEEKRQVLGGLGTVGSREALEFTLGLLPEPDLRAEAEIAALQIAGRMIAADSELAESAVRHILTESTNEQAQKLAEVTLERIRAARGYVMAWQISPVYADDLEIGELLDQVYAPETDEASSIEWLPAPPADADEPWAVDLTKVDRGTKRCIYLRAYVHNSQRREVQMGFGSDDGVKVWLNGEVVHEFRGPRGHSSFADVETVTLNAGWNTLLVKVSQGSGGWAASVGFRDSEGEPIGNLRCVAEPPR